MKEKKLTDNQPWMRKVGMALDADLPQVLRDLGFRLERDGSRGWRIPGHGGLIVWLRDDETWGWSHFSTDEHGDTISFLCQFAGFHRKEAVEKLASTTREQPPHHDGKNRRHSTGYESSIFKKTKMPSDKWCKNASTVMKWARENLWEDPDMEPWSWLRSRGLKNETMKKANLGWIPDDCYSDLNKWGLEEEQKDNGKNGKIWIPRGLTIPNMSLDGKVIRINIRRFSSEKPRYRLIRGSCTKALVLGKIGGPVIICESDLDAILIDQCAADIISAASLGSAGSRPDTRLAAHLFFAPKILVSLDADLSGKKASKRWLETFPHAKSWPVPWGKDPSDTFGEATKLLRRWIEQGLR